MAETLPVPDKTAIVVTTFLRDDLLRRCIDSIREFYPTVPVFVGDNGHEAAAKSEYLKGQKCRYFHLPFDLGVSGVRNATLKLIPPEYEYLYIVEDDCVFTEKTRLSRLRDVLDDDPAIGLCGQTLFLKTGKEQRYEGRVYCENRVHHIEKVANPAWRTTPGGTTYTTYDLILNVFLMRRQVWLDNPWDDQFKTALEHCDFFMGLQKNTRWKVAYTPDASLKHLPEAPGNYNEYRARPVGWTLFGAKWGLDYVVSDYNAECPLSYEAMGAGKAVDLKGDCLKLAAEALNSLRVVWWLEAGTCLGATREQRFIPHDPDIDLGVHPDDIARAPEIRAALEAAGFAFYKEWTHRGETMELSFHRNGVKLDVFFFRRASEDFWWHGAFGPNPETGQWDDGAEFLPHVFSAYLFEHLAETRVLADVPCLTPAPADQYLLERYGPRWRFTQRAYIFWQDCRAIDKNFFRKGKKTVFVPGSWDILNVGHLALLERAKRLGSRLVVGVLTDEAVEESGATTVFPFDQRARLIASLGIIDEVIPLAYRDPTEDLAARKLKPHYLAREATAAPTHGEKYIRDSGGKVAWFPPTEGLTDADLRKGILTGPKRKRTSKRLDKVAVLIKTFLRDEVMYKTVAAVEKMMPVPYRLYIADDGYQNDRKTAFYNQLIEAGHVVVTMPYNSGISAGRNALLKVAREDYILLLDDDTAIKDGPSLMKMKTCLDADPTLGIVAAVLKREKGAWFGPEAYSYGLRLEMRGDLLVRLPSSRTEQKAGDVAYRYADQVPNVFLAKREVFDDIKWDERIKIEYEHMDFFLRLMQTPWKSAVCVDAEAVHFISESTPEYRYARHSAPKTYFYGKHHIGNISNQF